MSLTQEQEDALHHLKRASVSLFIAVEESIARDVQSRISAVLTVVEDLQGQLVSAAATILQQQKQIGQQGRTIKAFQQKTGETTP
jgi:hypothetical protein